jgi:cytochrome c oxidase assembly protein subunit 15
MKQGDIERVQQRRVATWLLVCSALVFLMIVLGGVTRLTGSGLSMTDWRPVTGILPPLSEVDWEAEFTRYRASPEYRLVNSHLDVHRFKEIFWLEYLHRLLGRLIGIAFLVPFVVFAVRGYIRPREWPIYVTMFVLGGLQGLLGWYMVKSGLVDVPAVSQYRLTAHLVAALLIYGFMLWVAMSLLHPRDKARRHSWFGRSVALTALVSLTIVSGGFVAGLKAGKLFNTFPMMGDHWLPPGALALSPAWRNLFENPILVQFDHRLLASATFFCVLLVWFFLGRESMPPRASRARHVLLMAVIVQVGLGVLTLLTKVPVALAAAHQAVAVVVFSAALYLVHCLRQSPAATR